jgi:hypothetical protein
MKKVDKKEYSKPKLIEYGNLNEITKGDNGLDPSDITRDTV